MAVSKNKRKNEKKVRKFDDSPNWSGVNKIYNSTLDTVRSVSGIANMIENPDIIKHIDDIITLKNLITVIIDDMNNLITDIEAIHDKHKDKSGKLKNLTDESMSDAQLMLECTSEYGVITEKYTILILPNATKVVQILDNALAAYESEQVILSQPVIIDQVG